MLSASVPPVSRRCNGVETVLLAPGNGNAQSVMDRIGNAYAECPGNSPRLT